MKSLIESARKEVTMFIAYPEILRGLKQSLREAKEKRKVRLNIAVAENVLDKEYPADFSGVRIVRCTVDSLGMLIADADTLITISNWMDGAALLTQDKNLIQVTREYYENPSCCRPVT
jgi:sugar-specific transcriptional regulator TrmB